MTVKADQEARFREKFEAYTRTLDCVHCGLCLPQCPTYGVSGRESDSPRGRIYLMRGYAEGKIELSPVGERHLDQCIVCRGCETVCPSGIRMGEMMETFRGVRRRSRPRPWRDLLARAFLMGLLPHRRRIAALTDLLYLYERSGLRRLLRPFLRKLGRRAAALDDFLPPIEPPAARRVEVEAASAGGVFRPEGKPRLRAALFLGCIASQWCAAVHRATIRVLVKNGCEVSIPEEQTCCGALHRHAGFLDDAALLFGRNREALREKPPDVLVVNAAGCGAALKEAPHAMPGGLRVKVRDLFELLDEIGIVEPTVPVPKRVVHHQPCHLVHAQGVSAAAVEGILRRIPGLTLLPLPDADRCCGAGGIYNLLHPEMAAPIQAEKVEAVLRTGAEVVATGNPGCWLQIRAGLSGRGIEVLHPVELLDRGYAPGA